MLMICMFYLALIGFWGTLWQGGAKSARNQLYEVMNLGQSQIWAVMDGLPRGTGALCIFIRLFLAKSGRD